MLIKMSYFILISDGIPEYTQEYKETILKELNDEKNFKNHINQGFRLHHRFILDNSEKDQSFLKYIIDRKMDSLINYTCLTIDQYCIKEELQNGTVFKLILEFI